LVGTWRLKISASDGEHEAILVLSQDGDRLKGTYESDGEEHPAKDISLKEGELRFRVDSKRDDQALTLKYKGRLQGEALRGDVEYEYQGNTGSFDFEGKRAAEAGDIGPDTVVTWNLNFTTLDGLVHEPVLVLAKGGDRLKGTLNSLAGKNLVAQDVSLKDGELSFRVTGEHEGAPYTLTFKGKPQGESIRGETTYEAQGNTGTFEFEGKRAPAPKD
jgi:small nuclear ribonucleoprotein (snRNP)-like protein